MKERPVKRFPTIRTTLIALFALAVLLLSPAYTSAETGPTPTATPTVTATAPAKATRRTGTAWPTVTPTPAATATVTATRPVTVTVATTATTALATNASPQISGTVAISQAVPVRLRIPAIGVDAEIEAVEQDRSGRMDTPSQVDDVAWYAPGSAPGEIGNAVLAGHLDRIGGAPAVFWKLGKLAVGDDIFVTDRAGVSYHFRVTGVESYPYDAAPLDAIFGFGIRSRLNLITCRGKWDRGGQTYTQRLVVYSELVETSAAVTTAPG